MLFDDEYLDEASASRASPVAKDASKRGTWLAIAQFQALLKDLATLTYNITHTALNPQAKIALTSRPTPVQDNAFKLPGLNPACTQ